MTLKAKKRIILTAGILLGILVLLKPKITDAVKQNDPAAVKLYKNIRVEEDMRSIYDIAPLFIDEEYYTTEKYVNEVMFMNHMDSDRVCPGEYIIIPYYAEPAVILSGSAQE